MSITTHGSYVVTEEAHPQKRHVEVEVFTLDPKLECCNED